MSELGPADRPGKPAPRRPQRPGSSWASAETPGEQVGVPVSVIAWTLTRWWPVLLLSGLLFALAAYGVLSTASPRYLSQSRVLIGSLQGPLDGLRASASLGTSYADALTSPELLRGAADRAGVKATDEELKDAVAVTASDKSRLLTVEVTWDDPKKAQGLAKQITDQVGALQASVPRSESPAGLPPEAQQLVLAQQLSGQTTLVQAPTLPARSVDNHRDMLSLLAGLVGAFALFVALCFYVARRRRRRIAVRTAVRRDSLLGTLPILGGEQPIVLSKPFSAASQEYQEAAAHTEVRSPDGLSNLSVLGLRDAAVSREAAYNLALAYALPGRSVTFVDAAQDPRAEGSVAIGRGSVTVRHVEPEALGTTLADDATLRDGLTVVHLSPVFADRVSLALASSCPTTVLVADERERAVSPTLADARAAIERRGGRVVGSLLVHRHRLIDRLCDAPE